MCVGTVVVAIVQYLNICFCDFRFLGELLAQHLFRCCQIAVEQPANQSERNIFLQRRIVLLSSPESFRLSLHIEEMGTSSTSCLTPNSSKGLLVLNCAFSRSLASNESESVMISPCGLQNLICVFSAEGFIATNTWQRSPGVYTCPAPTWIRKPETPVSEPCGARMSAG